MPFNFNTKKKNSSLAATTNDLFMFNFDDELNSIEKKRPNLKTMTNKLAGKLATTSIKASPYADRKYQISFFNTSQCPTKPIDISPTRNHANDNNDESEIINDEIQKIEEKISEFKWEKDKLIDRFLNCTDVSQFLNKNNEVIKKYDTLLSLDNVHNTLTTDSETSSEKIIDDDKLTKWLNEDGSMFLAVRKDLKKETRELTKILLKIENQEKQLYILNENLVKKLQLELINQQIHKEDSPESKLSTQLSIEDQDEKLKFLEETEKEKNTTRQQFKKELDELIEQGELTITDHRKILEKLKSVLKEELVFENQETTNHNPFKFGY